MDNIMRFIICIVAIPVLYTAITVKLLGAGASSGSMVIQLDFSIVIANLVYFVIRKRA